MKTRVTRTKRYESKTMKKKEKELMIRSQLINGRTTKSILILIRNQHAQLSRSTNRTLYKC